MSTELVIKIWTDSKIPAKLKLVNLIQTFEDRGIGKGDWKGLTIRDITLSKKFFQSQEPLSSTQVEAKLSEHKGDDLHLSVRASIPCFRFDGMTAKKGFVPLWIEAWDDSFNQIMGRCREIEGDLSFSLANSGPFVALVEPENTPQTQVVNQHVEENLESVTDLILAIAETIKPKCIKAFTARGLYQPLNSHLIFFRDAVSLIDDLKFIKRLWYEGLPGYRTSPLCDSVEKLDSYALHPWRDLEASRTLIGYLEKLIDNIDQLTSDCIETIDWQKFDNYDGPDGRAVLDYPFWLNSFLDRFYIQLLTTDIKT